MLAIVFIYKLHNYLLSLYNTLIIKSRKRRDFFNNLRKTNILFFFVGKIEKKDPFVIMKNRRRKKMKDGKVIIIVALLIAIIAMSVGYAAFATTLSVNGTAAIDSDASWEIKITDIQVKDRTSTANPGTPTHTDATATFAATLTVPGDTITYEVTVQNTGTIDAALESQTFVEGINENGSNLILYTYSKLPDELNAGDTARFTVTATYDAATTQEQIDAATSKTKTITATFNYKQKAVRAGS